MKRHVILVGLPGAGKSTVGRLVAQRLGAPHVDVDAVIVRRMQMPIARIFGEFGEQKFRELEREAMTGILAGEPAIVSTGGGWAAQPGAMDAARPGAWIVYLRTSVSTSAARVDEGEVRPLLDGENPLERMRRLLLERESFYLEADAEVRNDPPRTAEEAAAELVQLAKAAAGW